MTTHLCDMDVLSNSANATTKTRPRQLASSFESLFAVPSETDAPPPAAAPKVARVPPPGTADCPVCLLNFAVEAIEDHVDACLNRNEVVDNRALINVKASAPALDNKADNNDDDDGDDEVVGEGDRQQYMADQQRHFELWLKRREAELADRQLAQHLQQAAAAPPAAAASVSRVADDERIARELHERENRRAPAPNADDERLARELQARENQAHNAVAVAADDERLARLLAEQDKSEQLRRETTLELERLARARGAMATENDAELARRLEAEERDAEIERRVNEAKKVAAAEAEAVRIRLERERQALEDQLSLIRQGNQMSVNLAGLRLFFCVLFFLGSVTMQIRIK